LIGIRCLHDEAGSTNARRALDEMLDKLTISSFKRCNIANIYEADGSTSTSRALVARSVNWLTSASRSLVESSWSYTRGY